MIYILLLNFFFALSLIFRKIVLTCCEPIFFQGIRLSVAGICLLGYLYFFNRNAFRFDRKDMALFIQSSLFFSYISYVLSIVPLNDLSSARYSFMFNLTPFITAIIAYFYLHERLNKIQIASLILGFIGFIPLLIVGESVHVVSSNFFSLPALILFISIVTYAYGWIVVGELVKIRGYSPLYVTGLAFLSGGLATLLTSCIVENWFYKPPVTSWGFFMSHVMSVVFLYQIMASNMYAWLLKFYSATFLSFTGFLFPIFSALLGWLLLGEGITYNFYLSVVVVTFALYLFYYAENQKKR